MTKERGVRLAAAKEAIRAYQQAGGEYDSGLEIAIDLLADLRHVLEREGADVDRLFATAEMHHKEERDSNSSGWGCDETFTVSLWLNNAEQSYKYWREQASLQRSAASKRAQVLEGIWTESSAAKFYLADQMQEEVSENNPLKTGSFYSELLGNALRNVNWPQVAQVFLDCLDE